MLIGITGQIGAGKTAAAEIFKKLGAFLISADRIGRDVVEKNRKVLDRLVRVFGSDILTPSGKLRRKHLGIIAFSSQKNKEKLNNIVHPPLLKELTRQVKAALKIHDLVVIDAALLIAWGWHKKVDCTVLVHAGYDLKIKRSVAKGLTEEEAKMRLKSQHNYACLKKHADFTILNNKSIETLELKVKKIIKKCAKKVDISS